MLLPSRGVAVAGVVRIVFRHLQPRKCHPRETKQPLSLRIYLVVNAGKMGYLQFARIRDSFTRDTKVFVPVGEGCNNERRDQCCVTKSTEAECIDDSTKMGARQTISGISEMRPLMRKQKRQENFLSSSFYQSHLSA
eukprot:scaffold83_cov181-Amphora_coffeaeformis.AAC.27